MRGNVHLLLKKGRVNIVAEVVECLRSKWRP
jgi:hypothetical protein